MLYCTYFSSSRFVGGYMKYGTWLHRVARGYILAKGLHYPHTKYGVSTQQGNKKRQSW